MTNLHRRDSRHDDVEMIKIFCLTFQIASEVLEIPLSLVHISETATNAVPNTSPTAASVGTDINGMAVKVRLLSTNGNQGTSSFS